MFILPVFSLPIITPDVNVLAVAGAFILFALLLRYMLADLI